MLTVCPECHKQISDRAEICPYCGYKIQSAPIATTLSDIKKSSTGIIYICVGVIALIIGLLTMGIIIGFFIILGALGLIGVGMGQLSGMQDGKCPYCNADATMKYNEVTYKCPHCKNISKKTATTLEKINK